MARRKQAPANEDSILMEEDLGAAFLDLDEEMDLAEQAPQSGQNNNSQQAPQRVEIIEEEIVEVEESMDAELPVDLYETEDRLILKARVAGVDKSDVDLEFADGVVTISGVLSSNDSEEVTQYHSQECYWGKFYRQIKLPVAVQEGDESIDAVLDEGVLILTFIKEKSDTAKKIKIS
ncbi:Hsp20/alpha crystallin family protein [Candidatus Saccharibacteria bacterium]|jgi:HSP20 family protein|nr:Hsp20/alpha crystallin family protein [Candidatus Saccharibacteria bacterium]